MGRAREMEKRRAELRDPARRRVRRCREAQITREGGVCVCGACCVVCGVWCGGEKDAPLGQVDNVWVASGSGGSYYLQRRGEGGVLSLGGGGFRSEQA